MSLSVQWTENAQSVSTQSEDTVFAQVLQSMMAHGFIVLLT